jgi:hypothetical protein
MSVGCATVAVKLQIPNAVFVAPPENEEVMLGTCRGP